MKILKFPELRQTYTWDCGVCALQSILEYYGLDVRESVIMKLAKTTKGGTSATGIKRVIKKYGLDFTAGQMTVAQIKKYLDKKTPVILLVQAWSDKKVDWEKDWADGHYVDAIGYDKKRIYFEDPSSVLRTYLTYKEFEKRWHDGSVKGRKYIHWGIAVFGKKPKYNPTKPIHMG